MKVVPGQIGSHNQSTVVFALGITLRSFVQVAFVFPLTTEFGFAMKCQFV